MNYNNLSTIIILSVIINLCYSCRLNSDYYLIEYKDKLDLFTNTLSLEKGEIIINDSILLGGNTFQIKNIGTYVVKEKVKPLYSPPSNPYTPSLYELEGPYHIFKKANNDTIRVIKNLDTMYFKFNSLSD